MWALELMKMIVRGSNILPLLWWLLTDAQHSTSREPGLLGSYVMDAVYSIARQ